MTAIALPQPHNEFLARLRTIGLGLGGRGVMGLGLGRTQVRAAEAPLTNYFNQLYSGGRNNFTGTIGFRFTVAASDIAVRAIGRAVSTAMAQNHRVGIWTDAGALVAFVTVTAGSPVDDLGYKYESLATPVLLSALTTYRLGSEEFSGGDNWMDWTTATISNHSFVASIIDACYASGYGAPVINTSAGANRGYVPPTFFM